MPRVELNHDDKIKLERLEDWMMKYACGFRNAKTKDNILPFVGLEERIFRQLASFSDLIFSSSERGYWIRPLVDISGEEMREAKESLAEERRRAINLYWKIKAKRKSLFVRLGKELLPALF